MQETNTFLLSALQPEAGVCSLALPSDRQLDGRSREAAEAQRLRSARVQEQVRIRMMLRGQAAARPEGPDHPDGGGRGGRSPATPGRTRTSRRREPLGRHRVSAHAVAWGWGVTPPPAKPPAEPPAPGMEGHSPGLGSLCPARGSCLSFPTRPLGGLALWGGSRTLLWVGIWGFFSPWRIPPCPRQPLSGAAGRAPSSSI